MKKFPPLKVWIGVLILYIIIQSAVVFYYNNTPISKFDLQIAEIKRKKALNPTANHVIYIGSSLVGHGVDTITSNNIVLHKIWDGGNPLERLIKNESLIQKLITIKPKLLLLQEELPFLELKEKTKKESPLQHPLLKKKLNWIGVVNKTTNKKLLFNRDIQDIVYPLNLDEVNKTKGLNTTVRNHQNFKPFLANSIKELTNNEIKVIISEIPKPIENERIFKTAKYVNGINQLKNKYHQESQSNYLSYTGRKMKNIDFIDEGHMAKSGRVYYTQWIIDKLKAELLN